MAAPALALSSTGDTLKLEAHCGCGWHITTNDSRLDTSVHTKVKRVTAGALNHAHFTGHAVTLTGLAR